MPNIEREYRFDDQPVANGGVAQNGGYFMAINYARMARLRPVTGYAEAWDWTKDAGAPADDGIFRIDVRTGEKKLVVSTVVTSSSITRSPTGTTTVSTFSAGPISSSRSTDRA